MPKPSKRSRRTVRKLAKPARKTKRRTSVANTSTLPRASVRAALDACAAAQRLSNSRGMELLAVADDLGKAAITDFRESLCNALFAARILDDMLALSARFNSSTENLPEDLQPFKLLPTAFLQWIEQYLELRPYLQVAEELEIPVSDLARFDAGGTRPASTSLVHVRVTRSGWRRGREVVILPRVDILSNQS